MLTLAQRAFLAKPFAPGEHGFVNKNVYLKKSAIRRRLSGAGEWHLSEPALISATERLVVMSATLTLDGESRAGVGTGVVITTSTDKATGEILPLSDDMIARNTGKAFKTAASDILPRAAMMFGIGDYLRDAKITNEAELKKLLSALPPAPGPQESPRRGDKTALDQADLDLLDGIAQRHTGMELLELLKNLDLGSLEDFAVRYPALDAAQKVIATRIVDKRSPVKIITAQTAEARTGSLYLSVSFGFNTVALFNGAVTSTFKDTPYLMLDWNKPGYSIEFQPPLIAVLGRDANNFPRIEKLMVEEIVT